MQRGGQLWAEEGIEEGWGRVGRDRAGRVSGSNGAEVEGERTILLLVTMNMRTKDGKKENRTCHRIHEKEGKGRKS